VSEFDCTTLYLRGIVYHGQNHVTSRVINVGGEIWYHDGMVTKDIFVRDGDLKDMRDTDLRKYHGRDIVFSVYAQH
jgi:hypothetical protein